MGLPRLTRGVNHALYDDIQILVTRIELSVNPPTTVGDVIQERRRNYGSTPVM